MKGFHLCVLTIASIVALGALQKLSTDSFLINYLILYIEIIGVSFFLAFLFSRHTFFLRYAVWVERAMVLTLIIYSLCIVIAAVVAYENFSQYVDLSYFDSAVRQLSEFKIPMIWDMKDPVWSQHFSPILFLFVPFYWLGGGARLLVFFQAAFAVLAVIPLYLFTQKLSRSRFLGLVLALAYVVSGGMQSSIFYGFHEVTFFAFFFFWALYCWQIQKYRCFVLFAILALFVKEEIAFVFLFFGFYLLVLKQWKYGLTAIVLGALWYSISFKVIAFYHHGGYEYWGQFGGGTGGGLIGMMGYALGHPVQFISQFFNDWRKPPMFIEVFGSFGFLPFLWPPTLLLILPSLMVKLLSSDIPMMNSFHYSAVISALMPISVVLAISHIVKKESTYRFFAWFVLITAFCASYYYGRGFYYSRYALMSLGNIRYQNVMISPHSGNVNIALSKIPQSASVNCQYQLCAHIRRPYGKKYPAPGDVMLDYVIIDTSLPLVLTTGEAMKTFYEKEVEPFYDLIYLDGKIFIFRKKS